MTTAIALEKKMLKPKKKLQWGDFPEVGAFIPDTVAAITALALGAPASFAAWHFLSTGNPLVTVGATTATLLAGWVATRMESREQRNGYIFDEPMQIVRHSPVVEAVVVQSNANWSVTGFLRDLGVIGQTDVVTETTSEQYRIMQIPTYKPSAVKERLESIASLLGKDPAELFFYPVIAPGMCAVMVIKAVEEWINVAFDPSHLVQGELVSFIGKDINGNPIVSNRRHGNHMIVVGQTDSGKTEVICNDMESVRRSGVPAEIYISDPKSTAQLTRQACTRYTDSIDETIQILELMRDITLPARRKKYAASGCDNWFEYREKVDATEPAIMFYLDELARFLAKDPLELLEKGDVPRHKRAEAVLEALIQMERSAGFFLTVGLQHPDAETLPTRIRNQFAIAIILSVRDRIAAGVAGAAGAERLPLKGGLIFQYQKKSVIGRAAYLKA